jgi:histidyl-tRNA synthetase
MTIQPRTLKGFRDYLPDEMIPRERLMETARRVYRSYGFSPIDTPALEYLEILTGKGSEETDRQLYRFEDHGGRQVGMRFDLTVPLARFVAQHINKLGVPFKRYHIAPVWRGENTQRGRYREFFQCDFDTIGTLSVSADIEMVLVIYDLMRALGIEKFTIRVNNRQILNGLLEKLELTDQSTAVLRALDKLAKIGSDKVMEEMVQAAGATREQAEQVLQLSELSGVNRDVLSGLAPLMAGSQTGESGLGRLEELVEGIEAAGVGQDNFCLDVSIARGLDYYTGTIVETFLDDLPSIGSVCSGGRYDNLTGVYTKQQLPGVGASLGLDRLLAAMGELGLSEPTRTTAPVFLAYFDADRLPDYLRLAGGIRAAGIGVELYPDPKKLAAQLKYASARGFRVAVIAGPDELQRGVCQVKDLAARTSEEFGTCPALDPLVDGIRQILEKHESPAG